MGLQVNVFIFLGMIAMLAVLISLLVAIFFGEDAFILLSPIIKYGFQASSLTALGVLFGDNNDREVFLEGGTSVIFLLISIAALCYTSYTILKSLRAKQQHRQHEKEQEKIRMAAEKQKQDKENKRLHIRKELDFTILKADQICAQLESGDRIVGFTLLLEDCGADVSYIHSHPKVIQVKELADELTVLERKHEELERLLCSLK